MQFCQKNPKEKYLIIKYINISVISSNRFEKHALNGLELSLQNL